MSLYLKTVFMFSIKIKTEWGTASSFTCEVSDVSLKHHPKLLFRLFGKETLQNGCRLKCLPKMLCCNPYINKIVVIQVKLRD